MEKKELERKIRLLYEEGYKDGKKQTQTPYKYTGDSDKGKELYDFILLELEKAMKEGRREMVEDLLKKAEHVAKDYLTGQVNTYIDKDILEEESSKLKDNK